MNNNALTKLPAAFGKLSKVEVASWQRLTRADARLFVLFVRARSFAFALLSQTLDLSDNALAALEPKALLYAMTSLVSLRFINNAVASLDGFDADAMSGLVRGNERERARARAHWRRKQCRLV